MSEVEQEVEDLFNEEILGIKEPERDAPPFPQEAPLPKPAEEVADPDEPREEVQEQEVELPPQPDEVQVELPPDPGLGADDEKEEPYLAWAKQKYGVSDEQLQDETTRLLAKSNYEQERMIGRQAEETRKEKEQRQRQEIQNEIDALNRPGYLTPEEDTWVEEAVSSGSPAEWAENARQAGRTDLYASVMGRWAAQGETEAQQMRAYDFAVKQQLMQAPVDEKAALAVALGQTFASLGLDLDQHGPIILSKLDELGPQHVAARAMTSPDPNQRALAVQAIFDLVSATQTEVSRHRSNDVVAQRVQEEELRRGAAGIQTGGPRVDPPKKDPFWDTFNEEVEERGWDGNRPRYGTE